MTPSSDHPAIELTATFPPAEMADLLSAEAAVRYRIVPLGERTFASASPGDLDTRDALRFLLGGDVSITPANPNEIDAALERLYGPATNNDEDEASVIQLVNELIEQAGEARASDIHLEPHGDRFRVRYRIDGALRDVQAPTPELRAAIVNRVKIMTGIKISEKRLPQDGRIQARVDGRDIDLRVSTIPTSHGESVVARLLDRRDSSMDFKHLGFQPDDQTQFEELVHSPDGVVLITGPTGSGKTTTLNACLNHLNTPDKKIITVEDPVEYQLPGVNQTAARPDIGLTFAAALRAIMRQAPNIIMIGEIRDRETAEIAINAALTGHLVLSTLHTNDAPGAATRLVDIGVKPFLIASALRGVVAQRLVRTVCADCATPRAPTAAERETLPSLMEMREGAGCGRCAGSGYHGRVGIFELMPMDDDLSHLIHTEATTAELRAAARARGIRSLRADALRKVEAGATTLHEALRVTMKDEVE